jgi:hypothetical protein
MTTKPGKHGTLKLYRVTYDDGPGGMPATSYTTWAYDYDHALDKWYDGNEDEGFHLVSIKVAA